ncbi:hypothetical protein TgHK011_002360 [Trichoderma gracile]|nr:hypothetical protein TgHK011_002360 [Trichoderma gracile]
MLELTGSADNGIAPSDSISSILPINQPASEPIESSAPATNRVAPCNQSQKPGLCKPPCGRAMSLFLTQLHLRPHSCSASGQAGSPNPGLVPPSINARDKIAVIAPACGKGRRSPEQSQVPCLESPTVSVRAFAPAKHQQLSPGPLQRLFALRRAAHRRKTRWTDQGPCPTTIRHRCIAPITLELRPSPCRRSAAVKPLQVMAPALFHLTDGVIRL